LLVDFGLLFEGGEFCSVGCCLFAGATEGRPGDPNAFFFAPGSVGSCPVDLIGVDGFEVGFAVL